MNKRIITAVLLMILSVLMLCSCTNKNSSDKINGSEIPGISGDAADGQLGEAASQSFGGQGDNSNSANSDADNVIDFSGAKNAESGTQAQETDNTDTTAPETAKGNSASEAISEKTTEAIVDEDGWINKWY